MQALFTLTILEALNNLWLPPWDWHQVAKAALSGGLYLQWETAFGDFVQETARLNAQNNVAITFEMVTGTCAFSTSQAQLTYNTQAYEQLSLCARLAWQTLPEPGEPNKSFKKCFQGASEAFAAFLDGLTQAVRRQVVHTHYGLIKQLAYENAMPTARKPLCL